MKKVLMFLMMFCFTFMALAKGESILVKVTGAEFADKAQKIAEKEFLKKGLSLAENESSADLVADVNVDMGGANAWTFICALYGPRDSGYAKVSLEVKDNSGKVIFSNTANASQKEPNYACLLFVPGLIWHLSAVTINPASKVREKAMGKAISNAIKKYVPGIK